MVDVIGITPLLCGCGLLLCIMYTIKNSRLRDTQTRFLGLMIVILGIGLLLIISGYHGLIFNQSSNTDSAQVVNGNQVLNGNHVLQSSSQTGSLSVEPAPPGEKFIYGIMFDAGSTGSRIHVFKFREVGDNKPFEFVDELFEKIQPGLSSYADKPKEAADSLRDLLDKAKVYIPQDQWSTTPIALKATAGLRKLEKEAADNILNEVRQLFVEYPFVQSDDSVAIMEGTDEGVFSWFTVNFYSGVLGDSQKMQGVMDLGGGSTQITFTPNSPDTISSAPVEFVSDTNILGKTLKLYTHSYLDLGLMAGRLQIMGGQVASEENKNLSPLKSSCFPETFKGKIEFGQDEYEINGIKPTTSRYDECLNSARSVVSKYSIHSSGEIQNKPFCAISYFYDRGVEAGIIEEQGGVAKVSDFSSKAQKVCSEPVGENPFLCLDLCYLASLLTDGYKMSPDNSLSIQKKINGEEISWALGAMFDYMGSHKISRR